MSARTAAARGLLALGVVQMAGDLAGSLPLKALGMAMAASPAPRVFTAFDGFEPFSTRFTLEWSGPEGARAAPVTPELYARLRGPYNRRNVYGAALAGGPVLADDALLRPMFDSVTAYALCADGRLIRELALDSRATRDVRLLYEPAARGAAEARRIRPCA